MLKAAAIILLSILLLGCTQQALSYKDFCSLQNSETKEQNIPGTLLKRTVLTENYLNEKIKTTMITYYAHIYGGITSDDRVTIQQSVKKAKNSNEIVIGNTSITRVQEGSYPDLFYYYWFSGSQYIRTKGGCYAPDGHSNTNGPITNDLLLMDLLRRYPPDVESSHIQQLQTDACASYSRVSDKGMCYANLYRQNNQACEIPTDMEVKDWCYRDAASSAKNPDLCEKIANQNITDQCYVEYNIKLTFSSDGTSNSNSKITMHPELCAKILQGFVKDRCYEEVAKGAKDSNYCGYINSTSSQKSCTYYVQTWYNPDYCNSIEDEQERYNCNQYADTWKRIKAG